MTKLNQFFEILKDDSWHNVNDLSNTLKVPSNHLSEMLKLLNEHSLIEYKQDSEEARINPKWKFICKEHETSEQNQALGTLIIPSKRTINIQGTKVTNYTDTPLELNFKINKELKEVTINKT